MGVAVGDGISFREGKEIRCVWDRLELCGGDAEGEAGVREVLGIDF